MTSLGDKLRESRKKAGYSQEYVSNILGGITFQTISNYERGIREPDPNMLKELARLYGVTIDYLLNNEKAGSGKTSNLIHFIKDVHAKNIESVSPRLELADILDSNDVEITEGGKPISREKRNKIFDVIRNPDIVTAPPRVPILGSIRAGIPLLSEQNKIGEVDIPIELVGRVNFALYVNGDSMIGAGINEGDLVICKQGYNPYTGEIVVALVNTDETTLKYYINENGKAVLRAANPKYKDIELKLGDQIQGHVVKIFKEPPSLNAYREYIYLKEDHLQEWNEVIENAMASGIKPSVIREMIDIQVNLAKRLANLS